MIFFISKNIGLELILFIKNKFKKDIKAIVVDKDDKNTIKILKKNFKSFKIIIWNKDNKIKNIKLLKRLKPKKFFLLWWKYILNDELLKIPTYETVNLHPSYLPYFKGKDPNFWSILNNGPYGVSIHRVNKKIDSGPILFRKKFLDIDFTIDAKNLYKLSIEAIKDLFKQKYKILRKNKISKSIPNRKRKKIYKRSDMIKESTLDLNKSYKGKHIFNLLRAKNFYPHDGVLIKNKNKKYSINVYIKDLK
jgi:methionyl-tRNA formyltransferase